MSAVRACHDPPNKGICMKTLISNNGGYKLYVQITEVMTHNNEYELKFLTQYENSKNPDEFQTKFATILTLEELKKLKDFL